MTTAHTYIPSADLPMEVNGEEITEFYQNMTIRTLSTNNSFVFDAFTDLTASINLTLRGIEMKQLKKKKTILI